MPSPSPAKKSSTLRRVLIRAAASLVLWALSLSTATAAAPRAPKVHTVGLGALRRVPFVAADVEKEDKAGESKTIKVRSLIVDDRQKEWTTGDLHDVTDRSFVIQRVIRVNDTLPTEHGARWVWQPGPWLLVDRISGRVSALHLPDFDPSISEAIWYRDYAAYCGVHTTAKTSNLTAQAWQIGSRRAAVSRAIGKWPAPERIRPVCAPAKWEREPMRVAIQPTGEAPITFDILGTSATLVEENTDEEPN